MDLCIQHTDRQFGLSHMSYGNGFEYNDNVLLWASVSPDMPGKVAEHK